MRLGGVIAPSRRTSAATAQTRALDRIHRDPAAMPLSYITRARYGGRMPTKGKTA